IVIANDCTTVFDQASSPAGVAAATGNVTLNDKDPDFNDVITVVGWAASETFTFGGNVVANGSSGSSPTDFVKTGTYGTLHLHSDGQYTFDVNQVALNALGSASTTTLHYTFRVSDCHGG